MTYMTHINLFVFSPSLSTSFFLSYFQKKGTITNWYLVKKTRRPNVENYTPIYNNNINIDPEKKILNEIRHDSERFIFSEDMKIDPALVLCGEVIMKRKINHHQPQQQQQQKKNNEQKEPSIHVVIEKLKQA